MNSILKFSVFLSTILSLTQAHTHEEISKCFLTAVHRTRQTIIESPNYPHNYKADICWDYVIRSPYRCPTKFHIQFLYFDLEFSEGCKNDYLAIGLENHDDDMDVLCGQVVGIKKYHTPDGVLRLRFFADKSPVTIGKGFKLLITRLACESEEFLRKPKDEDEDNEQTEDEDSVVITAPPAAFQPPESELMQIFRNLTGKDQYQTSSLPPVPVYGLNYPTQLPSPPYPTTGTSYLPSTVTTINQSPLPFQPGNDKQIPYPRPCLSDNDQQRQLANIPGYYGAIRGPNSIPGNLQPNYLPLNNFNSLRLLQNVNNGFALPSRDQYIGSWSNTPSLWRAYDNSLDSLEVCCVSAFQQKRFYLSSPGFPRTIFSNILPTNSKRDCVFRLQKSTANICRLRLDLKFFDFGQNYQGTGSFRGNIGQPAIESTQDVCQEDYIEIDNQRFCGCRTGFTFTSYWPTAADKKLRMRMGYSGVPSGGFLLELVQEECSETQFSITTTERPLTPVLSTPTPLRIDNQLGNPQQDQQQNSLGQQNPYGNIYPTQQQQQQQQPQKPNNPYNIPIGQQIFNPPPGSPSYWQQQNLLLAQQQKLPQFLQTNYLYPSSLSSNYYNPYGLLQPPVFSGNPYGLAQMRYARSYADHQPLTVVETNSTRKEYYYGETETPTPSDEPPSPLTRSGSAERSTNWDRKDINIKENIQTIGHYEREGKKCTYDMGDILRLSVDILWITRPICYAPQRSWFTNWIG